ncbi:MAG TPA: large-conductance mechanosensitive channel protein MscL [Daejeonella sp.]|nr:large-conductance mechanosensitive channel protein MscL [Daejeonella sp.]
MSVISEFKEFVSKGNVIDLAVGVIIGAAFGKIVTSLVDDIIMPPLGYILGGIDFAEKKLVLVPEDTSTKVTEVAIRYGNFINVAIQFLIIAFCIFAIIKVINSLKRKEEAAPAAAVPTKEEALLADIRDILRSQNR